LSKSIERLSSGYKINSAGDDPAGLVISEKLQAQVGGLTQAIKNAGDAVNMVKTAEGALKEVNALLRSMRDLAVHAANVGVSDAASAAADQTQITNALASLNKIADETQFGNKKLLDGTAGLKALITGTSVTGGNFAYATTLAADDVIDITITAATKATFTSSVDISGGIAAGSFYLNGVEIEYGAGATQATIVAAVNAVENQTGVVASVSGNNVKMDSTIIGSEGNVNLVGMSALFNVAANDANAGTDATAVVQVATVDVSDASWNKGTGAQLKDSLGNTIDLTDAAALAGGAASGSFQIAGAALTFQVGAYAGQTRSLSLSDAHADQLGTGVYTGEDVSTIDVTTEAGATEAIDILERAISDISTMRANLGATQKNVFESSINSLTIAKQNISASESSIKDTDMASEMVEFTKQQVLTQVSTAMLAQANQVGQSLLKLIQ